MPDAPLLCPQVAIPLERAGSCLQEVGREIYGRAALWEGARTPWLIRFVNGEPFYLSPASDGPIMCECQLCQLHLWGLRVHVFAGPAELEGCPTPGHIRIERRPPRR